MKRAGAIAPARFLLIFTDSHSVFRRLGALVAFCGSGSISYTTMP